MTAPKNPKNATAAEALGGKVPFTYNGVDYLVTPSSDWDYDALEAYEDGKITVLLRSILGPEQHAAFKATKPKVGDVGAFVEAIQSALGLSGN